jgi:hypothetical protein
MTSPIKRVQLINWTGGGGKYKLTYRVETASPWVGPLTIEAHFANVLNIRKGVAYSMTGDGYTETDAGSFAAAPTISPLDPANRTNWLFEIEFSDAEPPQQDVNPLLQPAEFSRFAQSREEAFERDVHGRPIRNSAFDRFDELLTRDAHRTVLRMQKNFASWEQDNYAYMNTVNRLPVRVLGKLFEPRTIRVIAMEDDQKYSTVLQTDDNPNGAYSAVKLEYAFAEDDWDLVMLDQGLRQSFRRWRVSHTVNASTTAERWSVIRAESREAAEAVADAQFTFGWSFMQEISPGLEPCRAEPPQAAPVEQFDAGGLRIGSIEYPATGSETRSPMLLNGVGKQQYANGTPIWLKYAGYFDADFAVFSI